jgi:hypothetical protein
MTVLLVVDRGAEDSRISAMVWTAREDDPRLLESKRFKGEAAFKVWLVGITTRYGPINIQWQWSDSLESDERLAVLIRETIDPRSVAP